MNRVDPTRDRGDTLTEMTSCKVAISSSAPRMGRTEPAMGDLPSMGLGWVMRRDVMSEMSGLY